MHAATLGTWISRIIRTLLAAGFATIAWIYPDLWYFYILAITAFITIFMVPRRCIDETCRPD